jgi:putative membrane protein
MGPIELVFGLFSAILFFGFWALVIIVLVRLVRGATTSSTPGAGVRILQERYARGEITEEEYLERRRVLEAD